MPTTKERRMKQFEVTFEGDLPGTPRQVWDAFTKHTSGWLWNIAYEPRVGGEETGLTSSGGTVDGLGSAAALRDARQRLVERARLPPGRHVPALPPSERRRRGRVRPAARRLPPPHGVLLPLAGRVPAPLRGPRREVLRDEDAPGSFAGSAPRSASATRRRRPGAPERPDAVEAGVVDYRDARVPGRPRRGRAVPLLRARRVRVAGRRRPHHVVRRASRREQAWRVLVGWDAR